MRLIRKVNFVLKSLSERVSIAHRNDFPFLYDEEKKTQVLWIASLVYVEGKPFSSLILPCFVALKEKTKNKQNRQLETIREIAQTYRILRCCDKRGQILSAYKMTSIKKNEETGILEFRQLKDGLDHNTSFQEHKE